MFTSDGALLAADIRITAHLLEDYAKERSCWSAIQEVVGAMTAHLAAIAGNIEKNARIHQLEEALVIDLDDGVAQLEKKMTQKMKRSIVKPAVTSSKGKIKTAAAVAKRRGKTTSAKTK